MSIRAQSADGQIHEFPDGTDPAVVDRAMRTYAQQKAAPKRNLFGEVTGAMANFNRGLGVGDEMAAGFKTAGNVISGKTPVSGVVGDFKRSMAEQRQIEDSYAADRPRAAALARGTGMAATAAVPAGNTANLFAKGSMAANMARGATTAGLQAATYAAADRGTARERLGAASKAARDPVTLGLGAAGGALATPRTAKAPKPVDKDVALLANEGVQLTHGQMRGKVAKTAEEAATSIPFGGDRIVARQTEGQESFNRAVLNRALKPIGETLPDTVAPGSASVKYAGDKLSAAYKKVLPEGTIRPDARFVANVRKIGPTAETMSEGAQKDLARILDKRVTSISAADGGVIDGKRFKQIETGLDFEINRYSGSADPDHVAMTEALKTVRDSLADLAVRQNPKFASEKAAIDRGWATLAQAEKAASTRGAEGGVFTPKQFAAAISSGDKRIRRRGIARGEVLNQDLALAGERILSNKTPDSGTGRRVAQMAISGGGGAAALSNPLSVLPMAATIGGTAAAYSPRAVEIANRLLNERIAGQEQRQLLAALAEEAANDPAARELYQQVAAKLSRAAGVAGGARAAPPANPFAQP
jgi:hypothetical protein